MASFPELHIRFDHERFKRDLAQSIKEAIHKSLDDVAKYLTTEPDAPQRCEKVCRFYSVRGTLPHTSKHRCMGQAGHLAPCYFDCERAR